MEELKTIIPSQRIMSKIVFIRGQKVILDRDIAELYGVETKKLNQAVKRNLERFPSDFMFQLTTIELEAMRSQLVVSNLRSQFVTSSLANYGGRRYLPYAFTEQGVAMLSSVLRSPKAVQLNIAIIRAFVYLRQLIQSNKDLAKRIFNLEMKEQENRDKLKEIYALINELIAEKSDNWTEEDEARAKRPLGFDLSAKG